MIKKIRQLLAKRRAKKELKARDSAREAARKEIVLNLNDSSESPTDEDTGDQKRHWKTLLKERGRELSHVARVVILDRDEES